MGEVWLARHRTLGGEFAIKLVRPEAQDADDSAIARFRQEAQVSAKLSRKTRHIVSVSDHGEDDGVAYLVMELLEGESLDARLDSGGEMGLPEMVAIVSQVARALSQAHAEQIVHRDLKPANVFLTKDEDGKLLVKLLDFGIARANKPGTNRSPFATGKDLVLGTPSYMSPEQARGLDTLDHRCDLWALAVVAYESLTNTIPWAGDTIEDIFLSICTFEWTPILSRRPDLPPELEGFFARAFAEKLNARFRSAAEMSEALEAMVDPAALDSAGRRPPSSPELPEPVDFRTESDGGADPQGLAVGSPTMLTRKKRSGGGWLIAAALGAATLGVLSFALVRLSAPDADKPKSAPPPAITTTNGDQGNIPPPEPATSSPPTTLAPLESAPAPTAKGSTPPSTRPVAAPHATPPPSPSPSPAPVPAPPPAVTAVAPPVTTPPPPTPPAPPPSARPPPDRSQVF
jgi:serine/threonine-protein kinase